jgi:cytochrome c2
MASRALSVGIGGLIVVGTLVLGGAGGNYLREKQNRASDAIRMTGGEPSKAPAAIRQYGCAACHDIPALKWPGGLAAPSLSGVAQRLYLGGVVENTPDNLVRWIVNPKQFSAKTAMPVTGISEAEARNVAAYLYER